MSDSEDPIDDVAGDENGGDDLFGDAGGDVDVSDDDQPLSDHELDEEDNQRDEIERESIGSYDRSDEPSHSVRTLVIDLKTYRHRAPNPKEGILRTLRVPDFLRLVPEEYKADSYEPDEWDLEEDKKKYPAQAIRWRKNEETGKLESNAVVYRWSDGSLSVAVGEEHFELETRRLAPPLKSYNEKQDANYYAAAAHLSSNSLIAVGHITEEFKVRPSKALEDAAVNRLMAKMDAANRHKTADGDVIFMATEDPESARKQAEQLEKDRERMRRKKESQLARADGTVAASSRYGRSGAMAVGALDAADRVGGQGGRRAKGSGAGQRQKRRRPEYDSDDDLPQGTRRQDDYDMGDAFIAPSDEDISEVQDDEDDEEEELDDDDDEDAPPPRSKRQKTAESPPDRDADGEADADDAPPAAHADVGGRRGRRHIVDDDED